MTSFILLLQIVDMEVSGGQMNYFEMLNWFPFSQEKISCKQSRENVLFSKTRKNLIDGFFPKLCLQYIYLD